MEIKYRWSENDLKTYAKFVAIQAYKQRDLLRTLARLALILIIGGFLYVSIDIKEYILATIFAFFLLCFTIFFKKIMIKLWEKGILRQQGQPGSELMCDRILRADISGVTFQSQGITTIISYDAINKNETFGDIIALYLKVGGYKLIPKSAFKTNAEEQEFLGLIKSNTQIKK